MKHKKVFSLLLAAALTLGWMGGICSAPVLAADSGYREHREEPNQQFRPPDWTETKFTCQSGPNTLSGTITKPKDAEGKLPVAVLLHGLSTDSNWCIDIAWFLAGEGIASVRFDFAGTGASTGAQENMTVGSEVANTIDVLDYVKRLSFVDSDNIFLVGKSMGGVDAVLANQYRSQDIKALVLWYPGFGVSDAVRHGFLLGEFFDPQDPPETITAAGYTYGRTFLEEVKDLDVSAACRSCTQPVMILHGDQDFVAPIVFSFAMSHEFPDCTLNVVPGGYHGFWGFQELKALEDMTSFIKEHIE